jgi:hypothetical protein
LYCLTQRLGSLQYIAPLLGECLLPLSSDLKQYRVGFPEHGDRKTNFQHQDYLYSITPISASGRVLKHRLLWYRGYCTCLQCIITRETGHGFVLLPLGGLNIFHQTLGGLEYVSRTSGWIEYISPTSGRIEICFANLWAD